MTSMLIDVRRKAATIFGTLVETYAAEVGRRLEPGLRAGLRDGESLPDVTFVLVLLARWAARAAAGLVKWSRKRDDEDEEAVELRLRRDVAARALRQKMIDVRALATALYGSRHGSVALGLEGRLPRVRQPESLWTRASAVVERLRDPNLETPANRLESPFDPGRLARDLETCVTALRRSLDGVERHQQRAGSALAARDEAMKELDSVLKASVTITKGFFTLAGRSDLARQLEGLMDRKKKGGAR